MHAYEVHACENAREAHVQEGTVMHATLLSNPALLQHSAKISVLHEMQYPNCSLLLSSAAVSRMGKIWSILQVSAY